MVVSVPAPPFLENDVSQRRYLWIPCFCAQSRGHESTRKRCHDLSSVKHVRSLPWRWQGLPFAWFWINSLVDHLLWGGRRPQKRASSVRSMFAREIAASMAARAGDTLRRARHAQMIDKT